MRARAASDGRQESAAILVRPAGHIALNAYHSLSAHSLQTSPVPPRREFMPSSPRLRDRCRGSNPCPIAAPVSSVAMHSRERTNPTSPFRCGVIHDWRFFYYALFSDGNAAACSAPYHRARVRNQHEACLQRPHVKRCAGTAQTTLGSREPCAPRSWHRAACKPSSPRAPARPPAPRAPPGRS